MLKVHTQYALQSSVYTHDMIYDEQQQILFFFKAETGQLTVLVEQHPDWYPAHVETIQEILNVLADDRVRAVRLLVLHDALSHGGDDIVVSVPDFYHRVCETKQRQKDIDDKTTHSHKRNEARLHCVRVLIRSLVCDFFIIRVFVFELENLLKTLHVPAWKSRKVMTIYWPASQ